MREAYSLSKSPPDSSRCAILPPWAGAAPFGAIAAGITIKPSVANPVGCLITRPRKFDRPLSNTDALTILPPNRDVAQARRIVAGCEADLSHSCKVMRKT